MSNGSGLAAVNSVVVLMLENRRTPLAITAPAPLDVSADHLLACGCLTREAAIVLVDGDPADAR